MAIPTCGYDHKPCQMLSTVWTIKLPKCGIPDMAGFNANMQLFFLAVIEASVVQ